MVCSLYGLRSAPQKQQHPVLMVGGSGTAKTTTALMYFDTLKNDSMLVKRINFSSATTAGMFQVSYVLDFAIYICLEARHVLPPL